MRSTESRPRLTSRAIACRETPRTLAASACEIQSVGFRKILDIVNHLCSCGILCNCVQGADVTLCFT